MEEGVFSIGSDPHEGVFRSMSEAEVSLDEMLSLACRQGKQDIVDLLLESGANVNHRNKAGNTPLLEACSQGHVAIARLLLDRSADIDAPTETTYDSALTWACTLGNVEIVRLLLDRKAGVEHRTKDGCTALMFAALAGHEKVAKLLLDHQAEINVESDSNKDSPLTFACWKGHQKVVELFLERSADIEHRTKEGFSPLMFAALGGHTHVAEHLLKHQAKVNNPSGSNNDIPLTSACWKGHHQVVYLLLQHNSDIEHRTKDGCTPLMLAAREGHLSVAQLLLNHGAKVNTPSGSENNIPLTLACWKGHRDVVNLLLKNVSNIEHQNKAGCTPLMLAAREGHQDATRLLLDSGAQINVPSGSNDDTPLTLACWKGHEVVVSLLIDRNSNVNHQTKTGCTPLMEATREGHVGVAKLLLEAGADVETPDNYGQSPFFMACWKGHADVAALLLEYDANKDCRTKTGITPLFQACRENHVDVVKLLLDYGCNPSTPFPNSRECPLTLAAEKGYMELTQLLLLRSAHVESRTKKGCSPLYLACREGYKDIAVMLATHGASTEAADLRGTTPLLAAYKSGHFEVVEWLLAHVTHLPSDPECNKALLAPMPSDTDLAPQRSKCIELIMKAKKAREQAALKNAQILFDQLDAEKEKKESRKKAAAKKRDKRKKKRRAGKTDPMEVDKEEAGSPVEGREGPNGEEGEESGTPPQPPPSPEFVTSGEVSAMTAPPASTHHLSQKKRVSRAKKPAKMGFPEAAMPLPPVDDDDDASASDSEAEYHDALEFSPTEPPDHHHQYILLSPAHPPSRPSATLLDHHPPYSSHDPKLPITDMSATRYGGQANKRSPQPKAEVSSSSVSKGSSRGNDTGVSATDRNRNDHVRGNQGAGEPSTGGVAEKRKAPTAKPVRKVVDKDGGGYGLKNRSRDVIKLPSPTAPPVVATRGVSSNSSATATHSKTESGTNESKTAQSNSTRGKTSAKQSSRCHRSNHASLEPALRDLSPSSSSVGSSANESALPMDSSWSKVIYPSSTAADKLLTSNATSTLPSNSATNQKSLYEDKEEEEFMWQEGSADWGDEVDLEEQLLWSSSTDDDKIRSRKLKAAQQTTPTTRPSATSAYPTPTANTSTSSYISSQSWQEVTRPTRIVQLTVTNNLVGRIIGRGGSKINAIQVSSGAHINVSRNIPRSTERLITIKGTQRSISRAQELIDEALSVPDSNLEASAPQPDRGPRVHPVSTSLGSRSDSLASGGVAAPPPPRQLKRYSDVIPAKDSHSGGGASAVETARPATVGKRSLPAPKDLVTSEASTRTGVPAWTTISSTFASITAATPSPTLQVSTSGSPTLEEQGVSMRSPPLAHTPSLGDSDEDGVLSPAQGSVHSPNGETVSMEGVDINEDFPPLAPQARSKSDPQVTSLLPGKVEPASQQGSDDLPPNKELAYQTVSVTSSWPMTALPAASCEDPTSSEEISPAQLRTQKLPFVPSPPAATPAAVQTDLQDKEGIQEEIEEDHTSPKTTKAATNDTGVSLVSSLAVGTRPTNAVKMVTIQQSLPAKSLPPASQSSSTPDLTSVAAPPTSAASRGGNYGAIGQPTRRSSLPSSAARGATRKTSYAGFSTNLENVRENDPLNTSGFGPPLKSAWPNDRRGRSTSLTGQHPFIPQNGPFSQQGGPYQVPNPSQLHAHQSDDPLPPPGTPDTPHGENHPLHDQDFSSPGGVYGAIGSNMPSSSGVGPALSRNPLSSVGMRPPYNSRLPHPPQLPRPHLSDIWVPPQFGAGPGPRMPHMVQPPLGHPHFPPQHHTPFPRGLVPPPSPDSVHMLPRGGMQYQHRLSNDVLVPNMGMKQHNDVGAYGMGNGNLPYKRWSVPSFPASGQPLYPPQQGQGLEVQQQHWGAWPKQGMAGNKAIGGHMNGQYSGFSDMDHSKQHTGKVGGSSPSMSDPWSHWTAPPGGPGFPSPPPVPGRYNGFSLPPNTQGRSGGGGGGKEKRNKPRTGRSISCVTEPWSSLSREIGMEVGGANQLGGGADANAGTDLLQLMKSLDIGSEHMQSLKARKLSLQQLHSMSEEEWRSLKLPVGPRVKLMNAISNIHHHKGDADGQALDGQPSEVSSPFPAENPTLSS